MIKVRAENKTYIGVGLDSLFKVASAIVGTAFSKIQLNWTTSVSDPKTFKLFYIL